MSHPPATRGRFGALMLGSMGVVFGDIGTSPIYTLKTAITQTSRLGALGRDDVLGCVSLMFWALMIVVTIKYVTLMMRADNRGEGGILSLMALAQSTFGRRAVIPLALGVTGAALFYGDAIITPAITTLSAVEGLRTAPGMGGMSISTSIAVTLFVLIVLFMFQARGTGKVGAWFGPVCLFWFTTLAVLGVTHIVDQPGVFAALLPTYGIGFLLSHGLTSLFVLGAVSLTITGAEALYTDMGHFGRGPIRAAWLMVVFPALVLNYLGQGALVLRAIADGNARPDSDWFFLMAPVALRVPLVVLATAASIIASQAVISGAYSMSTAAMQLGLLPRLQVRRTSETEAGQVYLPTINLLLMIGVVLLVGIFKTSGALADAYGFSVTGTMTVDTTLATVVVLRLWRWPLWRAALLIGPLFVVDLTLFSANSLKLFSGGWVPLLIAMSTVMVMAAWLRGSAIVAAKARRDRIPLADFLESLARKPRHKVSGTAIYLTPEPSLTPGAMLHNLKHNGVLHEQNVIVSVRTADQPRVDEADRAGFERIDDNFLRVTLTFGFMERPDVPSALAKLKVPGVSLELSRVSYFLGRRSFVAGRGHGLRRVLDRIFLALARNSADPSEVFAIPPDRVVEMGVQMAI